MLNEVKEDSFSKLKAVHLMQAELAYNFEQLVSICLSLFCVDSVKKLIDLWVRRFGWPVITEMKNEGCVSLYCTTRTLQPL